MTGDAISVARGTEIIVVATSGDVQLRGYDGDTVQVEGAEDRYQVQSEEGALRIKSTRGGSRDLTLKVPSGCPVSVRTASGDAVVEGIDGQCEIKTMSGDISARSLTGKLHVHTMSGDLRISASTLREVLIETVSGDCAVESALDDEGSYVYHSVSGDLRLLVPEGQSCTIVSTSLSGDVICALPHEAERKIGGRAQVHVNGGGVEWQITTTSGDVHVKAADASPADSDADEDLDPFASEPEPEPEAEPEPFGLGDLAKETPQGAPMTADQRMEILKAIESGAISVNEGLAKLRSLD